MSEIKLLPCPFCGSEDIMVFGSSAIGGLSLLYYVTCCECHCRTVVKSTKEEAIQAWNTRNQMERIINRLRGEMIQPQYDSVYGYAEGNVRNLTNKKAIKIVKEEGGIE